MTSYVTVGGEIGGASIAGTIKRTATGSVSQQFTADAAKAGTLTTRSSDTAGTLTLGVSHGVATSDVVDLYWDGGRRYGVTVGTVSGTSVPISGGSGDVLPAADTAVTCAVQQVIDIDFEGDLLVAIGAVCGKRGQLSLMESTTNHLHIDLAAGEPWMWAKDAGFANPIAGDGITHAVFTQSDSGSTPPVFRLGVLYDSLS